MSRAWTVAQHEYITNVRRKEFILMTLGLPLMLLVFIGISALGASSVFSQLLEHKAATIGVVDPAGALKIDSETGVDIHATLVPYRSADQGEADVRAGVISGLVVVDKDYLRNGHVSLYTKQGGFINRGQTLPVRPLLVRGLLGRTDAAPELARRITSPTEGGLASYEWNPRTHRFGERTGAGEIASFMVPYLFGLLLMLTIFVSASYLLRGIADEKENRVVEVIISSVSAEDLLRGKLVGLAGVGLTQVGVWAILGGLPAALLFGKVANVTPGMLAGALIYFVLGFSFYATVLAGLGALGTSQRETQQTLGIVSMFAYLPFLLVTAILQFPNGVLARILSYIPLTAPTTMVLRLSSADVPVIDMVVSAGILALSIWLLNNISARLFRYGLLIYGKRPGLRETLRWLREA